MCNSWLHQCCKSLAARVALYSPQHRNTHTHLTALCPTTQVSRYQKGKTNLDFTGARYSERQWYQLGHMQVCTSLQADNHASTSLLKFFYRPDALPAAQPTVSVGPLYCTVALFLCMTGYYNIIMYVKGK